MAIFAPAALSSGVPPISSFAEMSAPFSISNFATASPSGRREASSKAVRPIFDFALTSAPLSSSSFTLRTSPTAHINGVASKAFFALGLAPASKRSFTASGLPNALA